jgi:uncharacterized protein YdiU (UPF0061 family)
VIDTFYPNLSKLPSIDDNLSIKNKYALFFETVVKDSAYLVAKWQAAGFVHGVLNTENVLINGQSLHLGPYAFLDVYDPSFAPSLTDYEKRYSFESQPDIMYQNLCSLGKTLTNFFVSKKTQPSLLKEWQQSLNLQPISSIVLTSNGSQKILIDYLSISDMIYRHIMSSFYNLFLGFFIEEMGKVTLDL